MSEFSEWLAENRRKRHLSQARLGSELGAGPAQGQRVGRQAKAKRPDCGKPEGEAQSTAILGFEKKLWAAADKLRGSMDAVEYKHVVLGLIFLKYTSDAFDQKHAELSRQKDSAPQRREAYRAANVFWVPPSARWDHLRGRSKLPEIGVLIDRAMAAIEKENPPLKGALPKEYARPQLDKTRLGELIDLLSDVGLVDPQHGTRDVLGRVYEYFLGNFASQEGRGGGEFYTPSSVVRLLVEMIEPYRGRVFDPCCGSGGMFVQSEKFVKAHGGRVGTISVYGQEWNPTTWRLGKMNLALRGIAADLGSQWGDSFRNDQHKGLRADFVLANPPFNISDWGGEHLRDDPRWSGYRVPPVGNANFAWLLHIVHHLAPSGMAGVVLANGSMTSQQSGEGEIRQQLVENELVDCMVALPGQLFYSTQIPACLWLLARNKRDPRFRNRQAEVLFIDARKLGTLVDRTHRELGAEEVARIARTYHRWRGQKDAGPYEDVPGFCKSVTNGQIRENNFVLTPGRYVGNGDALDPDEPFAEKLPRLVAQLQAQFAQSRRLEGMVHDIFGQLGGND